jgi:hypothetical protein
VCAYVCVSSRRPGDGVDIKVVAVAQRQFDHVESLFRCVRV